MPSEHGRRLQNKKQAACFHRIVITPAVSKYTAVHSHWAQLHLMGIANIVFSSLPVIHANEDRPVLLKMTVHVQFCLARAMHRK